MSLRQSAVMKKIACMFGISGLLALTTSGPPQWTILSERTLEEMHGGAPQTRFEDDKWCDDLNLGVNQVTYSKCKSWVMPPPLPADLQCVLCSNDTLSAIVSGTANGPNYRFDHDEDCSTSKKYVGKCVVVNGQPDCQLPDNPSGNCKGTLAVYVPQ